MNNSANILIDKSPNNTTIIELNQKNLSKKDSKFSLVQFLGDHILTCIASTISVIVATIILNKYFHILPL